MLKRTGQHEEVRADYGGKASHVEAVKRRKINPLDKLWVEPAQQIGMS